ncbi:MAG: ABC transporter permease [Hymenobacteraceae bacterium]|nr:ABC transporter permease [Hymenobacteraceae bacterium]
MAVGEKKWEWEIQAKTSYLGPGFKELWSYRHLLVNQVRRHFILNYQQTVLGPLWVLFQPIITLITYVLVFNKLVGISTGGMPPVLFYFAGIVLWNFFSDSFTGTSTTFRENAEVFSKVYFPRLIMPFSVVTTHFLRFMIQLLFLFLGIAYYTVFQDFSPDLSLWVATFPLAVLTVGAMGMGLGLTFSVLTAKYRDMTNLVGLGIRLFMFVTPVIYPLSTIPDEYRWVVLLNPLTPLFELFRLAVLGEGTVTMLQLTYSMVFAVVILLGSLLIFNKQGDKLIDVV